VGGPSSPVPTRPILGIQVDATSYQHATVEILRCGSLGESRYVCVATVNNVIEACDDPAYREHAAALGVPVGFYGDAPEVFHDLTAILVRRYPTLRVAYACSPSFRPLTPVEDLRVVESINRSGARLLFVGLWAPKQEQWMAAHRGTIGAVMLGVGAAFDFVAGRKRQAPQLLQRLGLEWLFRLLHEPRRLWRRYLCRNPRSIALFVRQLTGRGRAAVPARLCMS
jgi:N-acetylglucosaminyldiphosphoundecaprenol N-acetyl-beta-D-mannosaminyltransferase